MGLWLLRVLGRAFPPTVRAGMAWHVGRVCSGLRRKTRWAVSRNLARITGQPAPAMAPLRKRVGGYFACYLTDFLCADDAERARLAVNVEQNPRAVFERLVPRGSGTMVVTAHLGHWELGAELIARWGYPVTVIYQPHRCASVERLFAAARSPQIQWVPAGPAAAFAAWRALKAGHVVATAADRLYGDAAVTVSLCGAPARIPRGPFALAVRGGVPLLCAFVVHAGRSRYRAIIEPPQRPSVDGPEAVQELADRFAATLERYLQRYPAQWYVFEPFWDTSGVG